MRHSQPPPPQPAIASQVDKVHFIMPKSRELQFAAMPIVQQWVNNYPRRMAVNDVSGGTVRFHLVWSIDIPPEDWAFFKQTGLVITPNPMTFSDPDMIVDLTEEKLEQWMHSGKHATQVCGIMCGEETMPLPHLRRVRPIYTGKWIVFDMDHAPDGTIVHPMKGEDLLSIEDNEWAGCIGRAGWETYLSASLHIPTIEIVQPDRPLRWLSKWVNRGYRIVIDNGDKANVRRQVKAAMGSIVELLCAAPDLK